MIRTTPYAKSRDERDELQVSEEGRAHSDDDGALRDLNVHTRETTRRPKLIGTSARKYTTLFQIKEEAVGVREKRIRKHVFELGSRIDP